MKVGLYPLPIKFYKKLVDMNKVEKVFLVYIKSINQLILLP